MRSPSTPIHPIDLRVGERVKLRRKAIGISQTELARMLGVTFQQVQKYEAGRNRISASRLHEIALALNVPVSHFFEGMGVDSAAAGDERAQLLSAYAAIGQVEARQSLLTLAKTLAGHP